MTTAYAMTCALWLVMPDHVHLILTPLINLTERRVWLLPEILDAIKGASAHRINRQLGHKGSVWQEESFDHVLRGSERLRDRVQYVLENPVRRGLVGQWEEYRWLWVRPFENPFQRDSNLPGFARPDGRGRPSPRRLM